MRASHIPSLRDTASALSAAWAGTLKSVYPIFPFAMNFMPNFALQPTIKNPSEVIHAAMLRRKDPSYSYTCTINTRQIIVSAKKKRRTWFAAAN